MTSIDCQATVIDSMVHALMQTACSNCTSLRWLTIYISHRYIISCDVLYSESITSVLDSQTDVLPLDMQ